jgi:hypothetical protein
LIVAFAVMDSTALLGIFKCSLPALIGSFLMQTLR